MKTGALYLTTTRWYAMIHGQGDPIGSGDLGETDDVRFAPVIRWLETHGGRRIKARVFVSSALVRLIVLPWSSGMATGKEIRRQIELAMSRHGMDPAAFRVSIQWPRYGWPVVAAAYPMPLVGQIEHALNEAGTRLEELTASAAAVGAWYAQRLSKDRSLLVYREDDGITGIHLDRECVTDVEVLPSEGGGLDDLQVWLRRKHMELVDPRQIHWLRTSDQPDAFPGSVLEAVTPGQQASAGSHLLRVMA